MDGNSGDVTITNCPCGKISVITPCGLKTALILQISSQNRINAAPNRTKVH